MAGMGMSPSNLGIEEIKLSKAYIQTNKLCDFNKTMKLVITRVLHRDPFYSDMAKSHLLVSRPAGSVLKHLY
jgi:hypothetical protein